MRDAEIEIFSKALAITQNRQKAIIREMKGLERKITVLYLFVILLLLSLCANMFIKMNTEKSGSISSLAPIEQLEYIED